MTQVGSAHIDFTTNDNAVDRSFTKVDSGFKKMDKSATVFGKAMNSMAGQIATAFAGVFAVKTIANFFSTATKGALDFERGMIRVNTVTQLSADRLKSLEVGLRDLSKKMAVPLDDLQNGLFDVASAGIDAKNQLDFLTAASAYAAVGVMDVSTAVKGLTAILKGYGLGLSDTERIMDLFLQTNVKGQTTLEELSTSVQRVSAIARNAGISIEEFFAIFATGTGVTGNAAEVATQFRGAINALAAPTKETSQRFKDMGIEVGKAAIEQKGFVNLAKEIYDAVGGDAEQLRRLVPEVEATALVTALATTQFDKFNENLTENRGDLKLTEKQYAEFANSASGKLMIVGNEWENFKDKAGGAIIAIISLLIDLKNELVFNLQKPLQRTGAHIDQFVGSVMNVIAQAQEKIGFEEAARQSFRTADELYTSAYSLAVKSMQQYDAQAERVSALKDALQNLGNAGQVFASSSENTADSLESLNKALSGQAETADDAEKAIEAVGKSYEKWQDEMSRTEDKLEDLAEKHRKLMGDIRDQIRETSREIKSLERSFAEEGAGIRGEFWEDMADSIVKYREERKRLEAQEGISESDAKRIEELRKLEEEARKFLSEQTVSRTAGNRIFQDLITEAEQRATRSEVQVKIDEYKAEEEERQRNFENEKAILEERKMLLEQFQNEEKINFEKIQNEKNLKMIEGLLARRTEINEEVQMVKDQQKEITKAWNEGALAIENINDDLINRLDSKYQSLASRIKNYLSSISISGGGTVGFADGGLTGAGSNSDIAGVVHRNEYVIPSRVLSRLMPTGLIGTLERMRKGFADGGFTGGGYSTVNNKTINLNQSNVIREGIDMNSFNQKLLFELNRY